MGDFESYCRDAFDVCRGHSDRMASTIAERDGCAKELHNAKLTSERRRALSASVWAANRAIDEAKGRTCKTLDAMLDDFRDEFGASCQLDANDLTDDSRLLAFPFLTQDDIEAIGARAEGNHTMARLVDEYCAAHKLRRPRPVTETLSKSPLNQAQAVHDALVEFVSKWGGDAASHDVLERYVASLGLGG